MAKSSPGSRSSAIVNSVLSPRIVKYIAAELSIRSLCRLFVCMNCVNCTEVIEAERLEVVPGTLVCSGCARKGLNQQSKPRGVMVFGHKTGGFIQIISEESHKDWKRYNPYGKYTGRGSGVHRMMGSTSK